MIGGRCGVWRAEQGPKAVRQLLSPRRPSAAPPSPHILSKEGLATVSFTHCLFLFRQYTQELDASTGCTKMENRIDDTS